VTHLTVSPHDSGAGGIRRRGPITAPRHRSHEHTVAGRRVHGQRSQPGTHRAAIDRQEALVNCLYLENPALTRPEFIEMLATRVGLSERAPAHPVANGRFGTLQ
jgi:hypothetical protein